MSSFQDLDETIVHNNPEAEQALNLFCNSTPTARNFSGLLPEGYCERVSSKS